MSLKIKFKDGIWSKVADDSYSYADFPSTIDVSSPITWPEMPSLKMSIHPDWLKIMDELEVGDVVTTHDNQVGVITKVSDITALGMKKFEVLVGNDRQIYFSINLKKIEDENEQR